MRDIETLAIGPTRIVFFFQEIIVSRINMVPLISLIIFRTMSHGRGEEREGNGASEGECVTHQSNTEPGMPLTYHKY